MKNSELNKCHVQKVFYNWSSADGKLIVQAKVYRYLNLPYLYPFVNRGGVLA